LNTERLLSFAQQRSHDADTGAEDARMQTEALQTTLAGNRGRSEKMLAFQAEFRDVAEAALAGDFSRRMDDRESGDELAELALATNRLIETMDRGLSEAGSVLGALANTDLTMRVMGHYEGAFAQLKHDTNSVAEKLSDIVIELRGTSRTLKTATGEILSGANDLSERTTRQ